MTWRIEVIFFLEQSELKHSAWLVLKTEGRAGNLTPWKSTSLACLRT